MTADPRILLSGGVGTGKTTLAGALAARLCKEGSLRSSVPILSTDDALWLPEVVTAANPWAATNAVVASWMARQGPWIIEGVRVPHALAIALREAGRAAEWPFSPPMIYLTRAIHYETPKQSAMSASALEAARHCERRLGVPVRWCHFAPTLAEELAHEHAFCPASKAQERGAGRDPPSLL